MRYRSCGHIFVASLAVPLAAQSYKAPRTADGHPDLQGIWQVMNTAAVNLEDHIAMLDMPAGRSVIVDPPDGKIPYTPAAAQKQKENFKNRAKADPAQPLLHSRRSARDVFAVPDADRADAQVSC